LITGFAGNVVSHIASPKTVSVGASTALFGLIAAQAMFLYKNRAILRNYKSALQNIGLVIVMNLLLGLSGGIDNWGHLGGLFGGLLLAWLIGPEIVFIYDPQKQKPVMIDTVPKSRREISCLLVTLFFAAAAYAL
ncbi:MAG: rhomboid family intramembrane serine protease, partial [Oscillospiraceae bacterium]|nr:rhomboid family intramembrane serine protease [Oscillospiraceae bacterium]